MNELTDETIEQALEKLEQGKTFAEILALYPEFKEELGPIFQTATQMQQSANKIVPDKQLLLNILAKLPAKPVTDSPTARYNGQQDKFSFDGFVKLIKQFKYSIPLALVVMVAAVIGINKGIPGYQAHQAGTIDQIVKPFNIGTGQIGTLSEQESSFDQQMLLADAQSINQLDQPYDAADPGIVTQ